MQILNTAEVDYELERVPYTTMVQFPITPRLDIEIAPVVDETLMKEGSEVVSDCMPAYAKMEEGEEHQAAAEKGVITKVDALPS